MEDGSFRKIDIDSLDDDAIAESDLYPPFHLDASAAAQQAIQLDREARQLLSRGDGKSALRKLLNDSPYGDASYAPAKATTLSSVLFVIQQTSAQDMTTIIRDLESHEQDQLMKYIYRGMANPQEGSAGSSTCSACLAWHSKLLEAAGTGCIIRVMSDRRRV